MNSRPGSLVFLRCNSCKEKFSYRLTKSPFRKKFCGDCAKSKTYENKRKFDERRNSKLDIEERVRCRRALMSLQDRDVNPDSLINMAIKAST